MSSEKVRAIERYYENIPYGNKSLSSEIHGAKNQAYINETIKTLVELSDAAKAEGDNNLSESLKALVNLHDEKFNKGALN